VIIGSAAYINCKMSVMPTLSRLPGRTIGLIGGLLNPRMEPCMARISGRGAY